MHVRILRANLRTQQSNLPVVVPCLSHTKYIVKSNPLARKIVRLATVVYGVQRTSMQAKSQLDVRRALYLCAISQKGLDPLLPSHVAHLNRDNETKSLRLLDQ